MVGGYDYANSQFDRASEAKRQPGSAFKPFVYPGGTRTGPHARQRAQRRADQDRQLDARQLPRQILWPRDAGDRARQIAEFGRRPAGHGSRPGQRSSRRRIAWASNPSLQANTSIALGTSEVTPLELTAAYVPFANGGYKPDVHFIKRITTAAGDVLYESKHGTLPRVVRPESRRHDERHDARDGRGRHCQEGGVRAGRRPARPAPARIRATPGSSATRPTSPPASGSAMTTARR